MPLNKMNLFKSQTPVQNLIVKDIIPPVIKEDTYIENITQPLLPELHPNTTNHLSIGALIENRGREVGIAVFTGGQLVLTQLINDSQINFSRALEMLSKYEVTTLLMSGNSIESCELYK